MQLTGKHTFDAAPAIMWAMLMDIDTLARLVPGVSELQKTGDNSYKSTLQVKIGPVSGTFNGNLELDDLKEPESFLLKVQQNSRIGNANAAIRINLKQVNETQTEMDFDGDVKLSGMLAGIGQRVISGASGTLARQFFNNLETELNKTRASS